MSATGSHTLVQELVLSFSYAEDRDDSPAQDDGVTSLLQSLPAMPSLRAVQIMAKLTSVGPVDMHCLAPLEHLALECKELDLRAGNWDPSVGPKSMHIVPEKPSQETVGTKSSASFLLT